MSIDYPALVHRVRELVWEHIPAGSHVAVVSKGDPALILFDQRHGWHYPQTAAGQYLGHHPETGVAAVAHLESLRMRGAQYFVVPSIYGWFLDFYTDLRAHLARTCELLHRDDVCSIYGLAKRDDRSAPAHTASERQLRDLVTAVLPDGCNVVALGWSRAALEGAADVRLVEPLGADVGLEAGIRRSGAEYVVVPAAIRAHERSDDTQAGRLRTAWPTVLDHRHVCAVFAVPKPVPAKR